MTTTETIPFTAAVTLTGSVRSKAMTQDAFVAFWEGETGSPKRWASVKQAVQQAFIGKGKPTGWTFSGRKVHHASAGSMGKEVSATVFFVVDEVERDTAAVIALGAHVTSDTYEICDWGQPSGDFKLGRTVRI